MNDLLSRSGYALNDSTQVWAKPGYGGIAYNDGDSIEERVANIVSQARDLTVLSTELRQHCVDWASLYHLGSSRANILRPFQFLLQGADVLEIGAGCGAITRYLGECGANVLALEGTLRRASITRSRTRDLPNVAVVADSFIDFDCSQRFDLISLIGVLEYTNMFVPGESPAELMLERVRGMLKPGGKLIVAIENQLGLKYFAGAAEDHLGQAMYGIEGRYEKDQPQTFGRKALAGMMQRSGMARVEFMVPFPDYKLPASIVTAAGFATEGFDASAFAWQAVRRDPQLPGLMNFSMELAWPIIFDNEIALDLANSFLIVASPKDCGILDPNTLAFHYSTERIPVYCKETRFVKRSDNAIVVQCILLGGKVEPVNHPHVTFEPEEEAAYASGTPLSWEFIKIVSRDGWAVDDVTDFFRRYLAIIDDLSNGPTRLLGPDDVDKTLPGKFFDVIPQNIICLPNGSFQVIDTEWKLRGPVSRDWLVFRSLLLLIGSVTRFGRSEANSISSRMEFIAAIFEGLDLEPRAENLEGIMAREAEIQEHITGRSTEEFMQWWPNASLPTQTLAMAYAERDAHVGGLNQVLTMRDAQVTELIQALTMRDAQVTELSQALTAREAQVAELGRVLAEHERHIAALRQSTSWRITAPFRKLGHQVYRVRHFWRVLPRALRHGGGVKATATKASQIYRQEGLQGLKRRWVGIQMVTANVPVGMPEAQSVDRNDYEEWIRRYDTIDQHMRARMRAGIAAFSHPPLISVVMPTYNAKLQWLCDAIESVRGQLYPHWELCIADDASPDPAIRPLLEGFAAHDSRIKVIFRERNGHISAASNSALECAEGDWVALLDHDDLLPEHALYCVADAIIAHPDAGVIYSDEDKVDEQGRRFAPHFKGDWNPDLFFSQNYVSHLGVYRRSILAKIDGFRTSVEGSQDQDLLLRCLPHLKDDQIVHIPRVLYHWRAMAGSTASSTGEKRYTTEAGIKALRDHFASRSREVEVEAGFVPNTYRVRYPVPQPEPLVSFLVPTRDHRILVETCVRSILEKSTYRNFEILILDNGSVEPDALEFFQKIQEEDHRVRVLRYDHPFNYSAINNFGVRHAKGSIIGLVNNDIEVISPEWLEEMVSHVVRPEIGCVGAKLYYSNDTVQHGGVILGLGDVAGHAHKSYPRHSHGYFSRLLLVQALSAITAACLLVRREVFEHVNGLDEVNLKVAFNDVDFCLKVREASYRNLWTPYAELYHHESISRGAENTPEKLARFHQEVRFMINKWGEKLRQDPYYNPNLTCHHEDFSLAWPPRVKTI